MDYNIFKEILKVIRELKGGAMLHAFVISVLCFLLDFFYLRHLVNGYSLPLDIFRSIYLVVGFFSHIFLVNKIYGKIGELMKEKKLHKENAEKQQALYRLAAKILTSEHWEIIKPLVQQCQNDVALKKTKNNLKLIKDFKKLELLRAVYNLETSYCISFKPDFIEYVQSLRDL